MTIDKVTEQDANVTEKPPITVQNEIEKDVIKEAIGAESTQKQLLQVLATAQPQQQIQQTAKDQLEKGYLDIKV